MTKIKIFEKGFLRDDNSAYPDDGSGFFSTIDVCNRLKIRMDSLQQWLRDGYVRPAYRVDYGRGQKSVFLRSQLVWIGVFKTLLDRGLTRKMAVHWANAFYEMMKNKGQYDYYDLLVFECEGDVVRQMTAYHGGIKIDATPDGLDIIVINVRRIINKINELD